MEKRKESTGRLHLMANGVAVLGKSALIAAVRPTKLGNAVMAGIGSHQNHKTP